MHTSLNVLKLVSQFNITKFSSLTSTYKTKNKPSSKMNYGRYIGVHIPTKSSESKTQNKAIHPTFS